MACLTDTVEFPALPNTFLGYCCSMKMKTDILGVFRKKSGISRVIDMIRQSFFARRLWQETKKRNFSGYKIKFSEFFFGKVYLTAHRFKICKNKTFEGYGQIYLYRDLKIKYVLP